MSAPQLPDGSSDLVLACLSIHDIHDRDARRAVIEPAARMLRPGGRLAIVDLARTRSTPLTPAPPAWSTSSGPAPLR